MSQAQMTTLFLQMTPKQRAEMINQMNRGLDKTLGIAFVTVTDTEVVAEMKTAKDQIQVYGLIHGGVYCAFIETICSAGAALTVLAEGKNAVGVRNETRFHKAARPGALLTAIAKPKSEQQSKIRTWEAVITDEKGRKIASGEVDVAILDPNHNVGGDTLKIDI